MLAAVIGAVVRRIIVDHFYIGSKPGPCVSAFNQVVAEQRIARETILNVQSNISQLFSTLSSIADQALFLTDLLAFFEMKPTVQSKPNALPAPRPIRRVSNFEMYRFQYPGTERLILNGLNFRLEPGERIALIGQNGQGKTTIVKLITRLYDPTEGEVLLDGVDLREYDIEDLCREVGVIFQDFMRYEMTARENIAVGRIEFLPDLGKIREAAEKSLADGVIEKLAGGYEQMLGRRFEGGVDLSGGEWQKLALARAYLREAQVLILDEPTAALDARAEFEVFQRFNELTTDKMALFISHRFSTVRMAERIIVLENGSIAEEGSHDRLMARGGIYAEHVRAPGVELSIRFQWPTLLYRWLLKWTPSRPARAWGKYLPMSRRACGRTRTRLPAPAAGCRDNTILRGRAKFTGKA